METTVKEIADMLDIRKGVNSRTVLFLGARVGGLFCNSKLYEFIERYSVPTFGKLSDIEKFAECYKVLSDQKRFSESNIHDILTVSLKDEPSLKYRQEDDCLVELVKAEYFDIIISTNTDVLLEDTFIREEMKEPHDYHVFIHELDSLGPNEHIVRSETKYCTLVKAFGDLVSRKYRTVSSEFNLDDAQRLKQFLESTLARDILVIGYDPVWDQPLDRAFPTQGGDFWYVNEEQPSEASLISQAMRKRRGRYLVGWQGSYSKFVNGLHSQILKRRPLNYDFVRKISAQLQKIDNGMTGLQCEIAALRADLQKLMTSKGENVQQNQSQPEK